MISGIYVFPFRRIDDNLRLAWSDCETYFLKSISQNLALKIASGIPKLGQQEMNRVKGFVNDLRVIYLFYFFSIIYYKL